MNNVTKSISSLMLCAVVIAPAFGMDSTVESRVVATQSKLSFGDACEIDQFSDGTIIINESGKISTFTDLDKPFFKGETGENVVEYSGIAVDNNHDYSWAKAIFEPKGFSPAHYHTKMTEDYYITSENAQARVIVDGIVHDLSTGDHIQILPYQVHQVINLSNEKEFSLVVKCAPSWTFEDHHLVGK